MNVPRVRAPAGAHRLGLARCSPSSIAWGLTGLLACSEPTARAPVPGVEPIPTAPDPNGFRYLPTLEAHAPPSVPAAIALELERPDQARVEVLVATIPADAVDGIPELLLWSFDQHNEAGVLRPVGTPRRLLRGRPDRTDTNPALAEFRTWMAAPRTRLRRPIGLAVGDPGELPAALHAAAVRILDPGAAPADRVAALVRFVGGLDDALLFEHDQLGRCITTFARTSLEHASVVREGARRARISLGDQPPQTTLVVVEKSAGWALVELAQGSTAPAADPSPTAPRR